MNDLTNLEIDTKNIVCYTKSPSIVQPDMHLENRIQQTDRLMTTATHATSANKTANVYVSHEKPTITESAQSVVGGNMDYQVSHAGKFVSVFRDNVSKDELQKYATQGYKIVYYFRGKDSTLDVVRSIVLNRCKQE